MPVEGARSPQLLRMSSARLLDLVRAPSTNHGRVPDSISRSSALRTAGRFSSRSAVSRSATRWSGWIRPPASTTAASCSCDHAGPSLRRTTRRSRAAAPRPRLRWAGAPPPAASPTDRAAAPPSPRSARHRSSTDAPPSRSPRPAARATRPRTSARAERCRPRGIIGRWRWPRSRLCLRRRRSGPSLCSSRSRRSSSRCRCSSERCRH